MRQVITNPTVPFVSLESADKDKLVAINAGIAGVVVLDDRNNWFVQWSTGHVTPFFPSIEFLFSEVSKAGGKIYEL